MLYEPDYIILPLSRPDSENVPGSRIQVRICLRYLSSFSNPDWKGLFALHSAMPWPDHNYGYISHYPILLFLLQDKPICSICLHNLFRLLLHTLPVLKHSVCLSRVPISHPIFHYNQISILLLVFHHALQNVLYPEYPNAVFCLSEYRFRNCITRS